MIRNIGNKEDPESVSGSGSEIAILKRIRTLLGSGIEQSIYKTTSLVASGVIKATPGKLTSFIGINTKSSAQYIQIFNSATVPVETTVPDIVIIVAGGSNFSFDAGVYGIDFSTGISWSNSSTLATKTIGSADIWLTAQYQ